MKTEQEEEDSLVSEIPVYLSKSLPGKLYVFQYPIRPSARTYDEENVIKARLKPQNGLTEVEVGLQTDTPNYDRGKGEQIALNVDGLPGDKDDSDENYFSSGIMDKIVLKSKTVVSDMKRYTIGVMGDNCLHLTPISTLFQLYPSLDYLDKADKRSKLDKKEHSDDSDEDDKAKKVTVRFEKPDTDRSMSLREKSYHYLQKKIREEPWIALNYHKCGSERSEFESRNLFCSNQNELVDQFSLSSAEYLRELVPLQKEHEYINPCTPVHLLSRAALRSLPLQDRLQAFLTRTICASFSDLCEFENDRRTNEDLTSILKAIQQVAVLVQGNWVVKSDVLHQKDGYSDSGYPNECLQKARDYILYFFTKNPTVKRSDFNDPLTFLGRHCDFLRIPRSDILVILRSVAKPQGERGTWIFINPVDSQFLKKYPDIVQRQQMIWQSRHEQLSHFFQEKRETKPVTPSKKFKFKQDRS